MKTKDKPFLDPRIKYISIKTFFEKIADKKDDDIFYITESFCIIENYKYASIDFGNDIELRFDYYEIAERNGIDEYLLFKKLGYKVESGIDDYYFKDCWSYKSRNNKSIIRLPEFVKYQKSEAEDCFEKSLKKVKYNTDVNFKDKYVVLDVETNGLSRKNDDLLSISIYSPSLGMCYNRFLHLDMQPAVKTTHINCITKTKLKKFKHISQIELNKVIEYFGLRNKIILVYSGTSNFDAEFINEYCLRHNLTGVENFRYLNIKKSIPSAAFGLEGSASKDNMCKLFGIDGVKRRHSSFNDCLLEWQLFEVITDRKPIRIGDTFYAYKKGYIVPVTVLMKNQKLFEYADIPIHYLLGKKRSIYSYDMPEESLRKIKKFPSNITGISIENIITKSLNAIELDNKRFLIKNKSILEPIAKIENRYEEIPIRVREDGLFESLKSEHKEYVQNINDVATVIKKELEETIIFVKNEIFNNEEISSQELVISEDNKVLALCDLSSKSAVLEIKTVSPSINNLGYLEPELTYQLYYQSNCRKTYYFHLWISEDLNTKTNKKYTRNCRFEIFEIAINEYTKEKYNELINRPSFFEEDFLKFLKNNPNAKYKDIQKVFHYSLRTIQSKIHSLEKKKLIKRIGNNTNYYWEVYI